MKQTTQTYLSLPETFHPASTASGKHPDSSMPRCYSDGRPYYSLNAWLKDQFGQKIYKLALDGGMTSTPSLPSFEAVRLRRSLPATSGI